jgi:5-methylcytosine-specific restriction endonuclease McrA
MSQKQYNIIGGLTRSEYYKEYRQKNAKKLASYQLQYRKDNRDYFRQKSKEWRKANPELVRLERAKKRATKAKARTQKYIRLTWLHNWESRICGICSLIIEGAYHIDHIVPLSKKGEHHARNMQLTHPFCNQSKYNKLT